MAAPSVAPVTRQVSGRAAPAPVASGPESGQPLAAAVADLPVLDAFGRRLPFGALFRERRAVVVFVRHFLCYVCKEYVEDLAKIPKSFLQEANVTLIVIGQSSYHHIEPFCKLTGYSHEIYVDPEREIYKRLGMKRGEEIVSSGRTWLLKYQIRELNLNSHHLFTTNVENDTRGTHCVGCSWEDCDKRHSPCHLNAHNLLWETEANSQLHYGLRLIKGESMYWHTYNAEMSIIPEMHRERKIWEGFLEAVLSKLAV
ncbi:peroxiredoxin-like 2C isoform X2 [Hippopotamus amphibius kiboko]|uniref:peroxiredoxin-like 2C isoform X2 n=1 Tax=Hippopotamus amphibius kiboko TaxID=575201 RepID=UPI0025950A2B|nr:peroxiredoxin-like 2C isoform X2 [Hippopotamus amphibius kiboko]